MMKIRTTAALLAGMMFAAASAHAQQDTTVRIDEHWRAYLGCWASSSGGVSGPLVCVVPTASPQTVEFMTVVGDSILSTVPLTASGSRVELRRNGCSGWESARWSIDERRLYTHAEFTCGDGSKQVQQSMISIRNPDSFSRIEGVKSGRGSLSRVVRFDLQTVPGIYPASIAARIPSVHDMPAFNARLEDAAEFSFADIADASKDLDSPIVEAWIADRGQLFSADAKDLRAMKSAGVPEGVIDMVVAVSNPRFFTLAQSGAPMARPTDPFSRRGIGTNDDRMRAELERQRIEGALRSYGMGYNSLVDWADIYFPWSGYGIYNRYSNSIYGGYSNFWGPFGPVYGGNGGWVTGGSPIVIVPSTPVEPPGRMINGSGYSQGGSSTSRGAEPRSPSVGSWDGGSSSSGSGGSAPSSGGSAAPAPASTGGGEQRTAKPRP
jgi:hypothetical protein